MIINELISLFDKKIRENNIEINGFSVQEVDVLKKVYLVELKLQSINYFVQLSKLIRFEGELKPKEREMILSVKNGEMLIEIYLDYNW